MTFMFLRRGKSFTSLVNPHFLWRACSFSLRASSVVGFDNEATQFSSGENRGAASVNYDSSLHLSPLLSNSGDHVNDYKIELVDNETWRVSTGLADAWRGTNQAKALRNEVVDEVVKYVPPNKEDPDFDEIEDMRIRGNLFYKLDKDSKEYEEYSFEFHRRKSSKNKGTQNESKKKENPRGDLASVAEKSTKNRDERKESKKKENVIDYASGGGRLQKIDKNYHLTSSLNVIDGFNVEKKQRTPTFNQLTAPYHEPFCLDIYISKASVRACIVHRATSNVVAVAHSISKDMKFDLGSTRNATACAAVGEALAQRALADDIHNVVYTPRRGDKLEGKLQIVLQSIIKNGVDVKVKIKQRKFKKSGVAPRA